MGALAEFGALLSMAGVAVLGNARLLEQTGGRHPRHGVVAVAACEHVRGVRGTRPVDPLPPLVAAQTLGVLLFDGGAPLPRETYERVAICRIRQVSGSRTVAGFADLPLAFIPWILPENPCVHGMAEVRILRGMAIGANFFADVRCRTVHAFFGCRSLRHGGQNEQQACGQQHHAKRMHRRPGSSDRKAANPLLVHTVCFPDASGSTKSGAGRLVCAAGHARSDGAETAWIMRSS